MKGDEIANFWTNVHKCKLVQSSICGCITPIIVTNAPLFKTWNQNNCSDWESGLLTEFPRGSKDSLRFTVIFLHARMICCGCFQGRMHYNVLMYVTPRPQHLT